MSLATLFIWSKAIGHSLSDFRVPRALTPVAFVASLIACSASAPQDGPDESKVAKQALAQAPDRGETDEDGPPKDGIVELSENESVVLAPAGGSAYDFGLVAYEHLRIGAHAELGDESRRLVAANLALPYLAGQPLCEEEEEEEDEDREQEENPEDDDDSSRGEDDEGHSKEKWEDRAESVDSMRDVRRLSEARKTPREHTDAQANRDECPIRDLSSTGLVVGAHATTGELIAGGDVFLGARSSAGSIKLAGKLIERPGSTHGVVSVVPNLPLQKNRRRISLPEVTGQSVRIGSGKRVVLSPKSYSGFSKFLPGSEVRLVTGTYLFDALSISPRAVVRVDSSAGPVIVVVREFFYFAGDLSADSRELPDLYLYYTGAETVMLKGAFQGTLHAPGAHVKLAATRSPHRGSIFGESISLLPFAKFKYKPTSGTLIDRVDVSKRNPCVGEPVQVAVTAAPGVTPDIMIGGITGVSRELQFEGVGPRRVTIVADIGSGVMDSRSVEFAVDACLGKPKIDYPLVGSTFDPFKEFVVNLSVKNRDLFPGASFQWDFGDGSRTTAAEGATKHDYGPAVSATEAKTLFKATLAVTLANGSKLPPVTQNVVIYNHLAENAKRGHFQPRTFELDTTLTRDNGGGLTGTVELFNPHLVPLTFSDRAVEWRYCDVDRGVAPAFVDPVQVVIAPRSTMTLNVAAPEPPPDVCGLNFRFGGQAGSLPAYAAAYFDVDQPSQEVALTDTATSARVLAAMNVLGRFRLSGRQLSEFEMDALARASLASSLSMSPQVGFALAATPASGPPQINEECNPENPGESPIRPGLSCQATDELREMHRYRIPNARKGDILVDPGCGTIGRLLRSLTPSQRFSHSGMMSRNFIEVRHSTSSEARYVNDLYRDGSIHIPIPVNWPSSLLNPLLWLKVETGLRRVKTDALRYGFPGTITQSVQGAFEGEQTEDDNQVRGRVLGFGANPSLCPGDNESTFPLVIKPPPNSDSLVRAQLERAADTAVGINGHYRFFVYSAGDISRSALYNAPASVEGWAAGAFSRPTVCSQLSWTALKELPLAPTLEGACTGQLASGLLFCDGDTDQLVTPNTPDGMYHYTSDERRAAGRQLYDDVYNQVVDEARSKLREELPEAIPDFVTDAIADVLTSDAVTDGADNLGNQVTNCFASDDCGGDSPDSEAWRETGPGYSTSPDDIARFWDAPPTGMFGYSERLVNRPADYRRVYRWLPSPGTGSVSGRVLRDGQGEPDAVVTIPSLNLTTTSGADGAFTIPAVPAGEYEIEAEKFVEIPGEGQVRFRSLVELPEGSTAIPKVMVPVSAIAQIDLNLVSDVLNREVEIVVDWRLFEAGDILDPLDKDGEASGAFQAFRTIGPDTPMPVYVSFDTGCRQKEVQAYVDVVLFRGPEPGSINALWGSAFYEGQDGCTNMTCWEDFAGHNCSGVPTLGRSGTVPAGQRVDFEGWRLDNNFSGCGNCRDYFEVTRFYIHNRRSL